MTPMSSRRPRKRKLKAEINVVPYIDVMLVLLIIFMVTAPLLNLGVDIDLPQSKARPIEQKKEPIIVSLNREGKLWITLQGAKNKPVSEDEMVAQVGAYLRNNKDVPVYVAADNAFGSISSASTGGPAGFAGAVACVQYRPKNTNAKNSACRSSAAMKACTVSARVSFTAWPLPAGSSGPRAARWRASAAR